MQLDMTQSEVWRREYYKRQFKFNPKLQDMVARVICQRYLQWQISTDSPMPWRSQRPLIAPEDQE